MIKIKRYTINDVKEWNEFVEKSKNGTFLFNRSYMDYHSDRFVDHSLMFYDEKGRLVAVMPGNEVGDEYWSHQGLTYGGLVLTAKSSVIDVMRVFDIVVEYLRMLGFKVWHYKQMPTIYHKIPSEEDEYILWRYGASVEVCNIATAIPLHANVVPTVEPCRKRRYRQAEKIGFKIVENGPVETLWPIIEESLMAHHKAKPIHNASEMRRLMNALPDNIKCDLAVRVDGSVAAGVILYETQDVIHLQYGHATLKGYEEHVMDYLYFELINRYRKDEHTKYFDFGTSNEDCGRYLNENLVIQKEGFGGRSVAYKTYRIDL